jgi:hypothetical protein
MRRVLATLTVMFALVAPAIAQDYPNRAVKIVVPFAAGGPADVYARFLAQRLQDAMGQPFVVEDRPGGGSVVGTDVVAKSAPDGYTLLLMSNTHTVNESLMPDKPFKLMRDFVAVAPINYSDLVLVVNPAVPAHSLAELIALAKAQPGKLNYASSGPGTPYHMAGELFKSMAGVDIVHVPYKESSGARTGVLGGQVEMMFDAVTVMNEHGHRHERARQGRQGARHRHQRVRPLRGDARRADPGRGGRSRIRRGHLARADGAQGHAGRRGDPPERRSDEDRRQAGRSGRVGEAGRHRDGPVTRGVYPLPQRRRREMGAGRPHFGGAGRPLSGSAVASGRRVVRWHVSCVDSGTDAGNARL